MASHERCPYSLEQLDRITTSVEHIFPEAMGGGRDYSVRVSRDENSRLGTRIDAPLLSSFLIAGLRLRHGIKSRSGPPKWRLQGRFKNSGRQVEVEFSEDGEVKFHVPTNVKLSEDRKAGTVSLPAEKRARFLDEFVRNHLRKGRTVSISREASTLEDEVEVGVAIDAVALKRALCKIAYLAVYDFLGDAFLEDPHVAEWHKSFLSEKDEDLSTARLRGLAFDCQQVVDILIPSLESHEHAATVVNMGQPGPVVAVALFGRQFHIMMCIASETSNYGLEMSEGRITICNAQDRSIRHVDFADHITQLADAQIPVSGLNWQIEPE